MIEKLRKRAEREAPPLQERKNAEFISSALPPDSDVPEFCARVHKLLEERPELLSAVNSAADMQYFPLTEQDAEDLAELQLELFPAASYPGGAARCAEILSEPGVVALKACFPGDESRCLAGLFMAAGSRAAIEFCTPDSTLSTLRENMTVPRRIPFDTKERRELAYILSVGV